MARKNTSKNEVDELEQSFRKVAGKYAKPGPPVTRGSTITVISVIAAVVVLVFALTACGFLLFNNSNSSIKVNLSIAGVNVKDMKKQEAIDAVSKVFADNLSTKTMVVTIEDQVIELTPELTGITLDIERAISDACEMTATESSEFDLKPYFNLNKDGIINAIRPTIENKNSTLTHTTCSVDGESPSELNPEDTKVYQTLKVLVGQPGINLDIDVLYAAILDSYAKNQYALQYDFAEVEPNLPDLQKTFDENCIAPIDGSVDVDSGKITEEKIGYGFNIEQVTEAINNAQYGETLEIPFVILQPEKTKDQAIEEVFPDVLSSYTAKSGSIPGGRDVNLRLSCEKINEYIMKPGDLFDYNPTLGKRTAEAGWKKADGYIGLETVSTYGGGICQASSSLYYCALQADLEIVERYNHVFISSYMPYGMDATVSWGSPDFKFRNNTEHPILIQASASGGSTTVTLRGTDDKDYYVKMEYTILAIEKYETEYVEIHEDDNPRKYKDGDVIATPYTGYVIETYRCKYSKADDSLISKKVEALNSYSKRNYMIAKIITDEVPEDTTSGEIEGGGEGGENTGGSETNPDNTGGTEQTPSELPGSQGGIGEG